MKSVKVEIECASSQVGNCDIGNARERVDIWFLGGFLQPDGTLASYYNILLLVMYFCEVFLKWKLIGQTLCLPDSSAFVNKFKGS